MLSFDNNNINMFIAAPQLLSFSKTNIGHENLPSDMQGFHCIPHLSSSRVKSRFLAKQCQCLRGVFPDEVDVTNHELLLIKLNDVESEMFVSRRHMVCIKC